MTLLLLLLLALFLCLIKVQSCAFHDLSQPIQSILCAVERGLLKITLKDELSEKACWLGKKYCNETMKIPLQFEVPPSSPYNETANLQYKQLAQKAEIAVPQTWWREGFADEKLLLTKNFDYLPKKLLNVSIKSNGKLKILYHCVSLPHFLRQSYDYASYKPKTNTTHTCKAMNDTVVKTFFTLWNLHRDDLDGAYSLGRDNQTTLWLPQRSNQNFLTKAASHVLEYFYAHYSAPRKCFEIRR